MSDDPGILDLPVPQGEGLYRRVKIAVGLDDPDVRTNVVFRLRQLVYGPWRMERVFRLAARATDVADLGSGSGWVALEVARRNPRARVVAVDRDPALQEWARTYAAGVRTRGALRHEVADLATWDPGPGSLDAALALFALGCLAEPLAVLERIHAALRPGGLLIYMDGTEPPILNLRRLARLTRQAPEGIRAAFLADGVRRHRPPGAPPETEVVHRLRDRFEVFHESRTRAFLDLHTGRYRVREALWRLPLLKAADEAAMAAGLLEGSVRFVLARKPG